MMFMHAHGAKSAQTQQTIAKIPGVSPSAQENEADNSAASEFRQILIERAGRGIRPQGGGAKNSENGPKAAPDIAQPGELPKLTPQAKEVAIEPTLLADLLRKLEPPIDEKPEPVKQREKDRGEGSDAELGTQPSVLALIAPMQLGHDASAPSPEKASVDIETKLVADLTDSQRRTVASDQQPSPAAIDVQSIDGAVVLSSEVRNFPDLSPHRAPLHDVREPPLVTASNSAQPVEIAHRHGGQSLSLVLALPDAEPLRCSVRNIGDTISISLATSDPQTVAYLRDNDQVLRSNLERMGIQTDALQIKLSATAPQASQDMGQSGSQGQQPGSQGAPSGQRHNNQSPFHERQPNQSGHAFNDDQLQDDRPRPGGRYL